MSVKVYGCNHIAIEVDDVERAVAFYSDVFNPEQIAGGEGDFRDPFGNHVQVVDLHDESLVRLLPYQEVQKAGIVFAER